MSFPSTKFLAVKPNEMAGLDLGHGSEIDVSLIQLYRLKSFRIYREDYLNSLGRLLKRHRVCASINSWYEGVVTSTSILGSIRGPGRIYLYHWPNGELKTLVKRENIVLVDDSYWLRFYPFLISTQSGAHTEYSINEDFFKCTSMARKGPIEIITHNNHFGHFLYDNLPLLAGVSPINIGECYGLEYGYKSGIKELLHLLKLKNINNADTFSIMPSGSYYASNYMIEASDVVEYFSTSPVINSFLLMRQFRKIRLASANISTSHHSCSSRVFLCRNGIDDTRIANRSSLIQLVTERYGFSCINPTGLSEWELLLTLHQADIILCEAGSSTVVASVYSKDTAKLVCLVPERLFLKPTHDMILSGIPYHLIYPQKMNFFTGQTIIPNHTQTSDIVYYDLDGLSALIEHFT